MLDSYPCRKQISCVAVVLLLLLSSFDSLQAMEFKKGESVRASGRFTDLLFLAGGEVHADIDSTDDIFMVGREIRGSGGTQENLFAAGGSISLQKPRARTGVLAGGRVSIDGGELHDLILASGNVRIARTQITDDTVLAAGQIEITSDVVLGDSVTLAGGDVRIAGHAKGDVDISAGNVTLDGTFDKNLRVRADHVTLGPNARIQGDFLHGVKNLEVSPGAQILGRNESLPLPEARRASGVWSVIAGTLFFFGLLLAPMLAFLLFPKFIQDSARHVRLSFWESLGKGLVWTLIAPTALVILFISVIGIPVGVFAIPFLAVAGLMAWTIAAFVSGQQLRSWIQKRRPESTEPASTRTLFAWTLFGNLTLLILMSIPFIGFLICLLLFLSGLGALFTQLRGTRPQPQKPPPEPRKEFVPAENPV